MFTEILFRFSSSLLLLLGLTASFSRGQSALPSQGRTGPKIPGTYTSLDYVEESGDLVGEELRIVWTTSEYEGTLQIAEGAPSSLILVDIKVEGSHVSFGIPEPFLYAGSFSGVVAANGIVGHFRFKSGAAEKVTLKRGKSYWD